MIADLAELLPLASHCKKARCLFQVFSVHNGMDVCEYGCLSLFDIPLMKWEPVQGVLQPWIDCNPVRQAMTGNR